MQQLQIPAVQEILSVGSGLSGWPGFGAMLTALTNSVAGEHTNANGVSAEPAPPTPIKRASIAKTRISLATLRFEGCGLRREKACSPRDYSYIAKPRPKPAEGPRHTVPETPGKPDSGPSRRHLSSISETNFHTTVWSGSLSATPLRYLGENNRSVECARHL